MRVGALGAATALGSALAVAGLLHAAVNLRLLVRPDAPREALQAGVAVLIPARNEAPRIAATVASALAQQQVPQLTVTVLDDASTDGTSAVARATGGDDPRLTVLEQHEEPPAGWLGKPYACHRLAQTTDADVLVFLDADVVLQPAAVASAAGLLLACGADLASPWPRQLSAGVLQRLVQPLQQWSWVTTMPLGLAEHSSRASLAAANGQFLVVRRTAYTSIGGHGAVRDSVLEDIELARAVKRAGMRAVVWDGSALSSCRMYGTSGDLREGYRKSLWAAFGPQRAPLPVRAAAAAGAVGLLGLAYLLPPAAMLLGRRSGTRVVGAAGFAAAVANRALVARRTGSPVWPDSLAHPASVAAFGVLTVDSLLAAARGTAAWKGRSVGPPRARRRSSGEGPAYP